ncbi:serine hydrolase [Streptomyces sp. VRA16 Mangrove soil]|uniref:serine hydrolase n=1 Tax=Streptomyces sp. VRA16 Mangrove soil TaxID=2817434 RepID=UPI001A9FCCBE|nr:serine hydrolase [Streptomyces sp. VRA16 Mangrove soil]MBO1335411.1 serine hydrolase [Streptomyces sp. VRA16 Mangrove soil]
MRITLAALAAVTALLTATPTAAAADRTPTCRAPKHPALAKQLARDIRAALAHRRGTVSLAVHDDRTKVDCTLAPATRYDSASIVKVLMMEATLRRAENRDRPLTRWERGNVRPMIRSSDNTAASRLWNDLGHPYLAATLHRAGTTRTSLGPYGYWGLTRTTAADQMRLLAALTGPRSFLSAGSRAYGLKLMSEVQKNQRWGVPAGMPRGLRAHLKNGWLPRATHGWRIHSIGAFTGAGRSYRIAVLSHDNPSMKYGVRTVERVAQAVHRALNKGRAAGLGLTPPEEISEIPDGSVPPDAPELPGPYGLQGLATP